MKLNLDKYYTNKELAKHCIDIAFEKLNDITEVIEPSAGNGSFSLQIPNCIAYDLEPEHESIIKQDFLKLELPYKKGRLFIGNPPFGRGNSLSMAFYKKCVKIGDYIAFILPISQYNNNIQLFDFDLIHSEILPEIEYSGKILNCCFNVYNRPQNGLNKKPLTKIKGIEVIEYRRDGREINIPENFDFCMGTFGAGCVGRKPENIGSFALECYFYITHELKEQIINVLKNTDWKTISKGISGTYRLPQWKIMKVLNEQIPNLNGFEKTEERGQKIFNYGLFSDNLD